MKTSFRILLSILLVISIIALGYLGFTGLESDVEKIFLTNITESSTTIVWYTEIETEGKVIVESVGEEEKFGVFYDDRDIEYDDSGNKVLKGDGSQKRRSHHVTVSGLMPESQYRIKIDRFFKDLDKTKDGISFPIMKTNKVNESLKVPDPGYGEITYNTSNNVPDMVVLISKKITSEGQKQLVSSPVASNNTYSVDLNLLETSQGEDLQAIDLSMLILGEDFRVSSFDFSLPAYKPFQKVLIESNLESQFLDGKFFEDAYAVLPDGQSCTSDSDCQAFCNICFDGSKYCAGYSLTGSQVCDGSGTNSTIEEPSQTVPDSSPQDSGSGTQLGQNDCDKTNCPDCNPGASAPNDGVVLCEGNTYCLGKNSNMSTASSEYCADKWGNSTSSSVTTTAGVSNISQESIGDDCSGNPCGLDSCNPGASAPNDGVALCAGNTYCVGSGSPIISAASSSYCSGRWGDLSGSSSSTQAVSYQPSLNRSQIEAANQSLLGSSCEANAQCGGMGLVCEQATCQDLSLSGYVYYSEDYSVDTVSYQPNSNNVVVSANFSSTTQDMASAMNCLSSSSAVQNDGCQLYIASGYRSVKEQNEIYQNCLNTQGSADACQGVAAPGGRSQHNGGYAVDLYRQCNGQIQNLNSEYIAAANDCGLMQPISGDPPHYYLPNTITVPVTAASADLSMNLFTPVQAEEGKDSFLIDNAGVYNLESDEYELGIKKLELSTEEGMTVNIKFFVDSNGNGKKDPNEDFLSNLSSINISEEKEGISYSLNYGWNLINIPVLMNSVSTAGDLIDTLQSQGADVLHVAKYSSGEFQIYTKRNGETEFSNDFYLIPGEGYFIFSQNGKDVILYGNRYMSEIDTDFSNGWNLIGVNSGNRMYDASSLLEALEQSNLTATTVSRYDAGIYQSLIKEDEMLYGNDYNLVDTEGYFVKVLEGGGTTVPL